MRPCLLPNNNRCPLHETPEKINIVGRSASVTLYRGSTQQRAAADGQTDSGEALPADFVAARNFLFLASKYTGLKDIKNPKMFDILIYLKFACPTHNLTSDADTSLVSLQPVPPTVLYYCKCSRRNGSLFFSYGNIFFLIIVKILHSATRKNSSFPKLPFRNDISLCGKGWESKKRFSLNLSHHQNLWNVMKTSAALGGLPNRWRTWNTGQISGWTLSFFKAVHFCWFGYSYNQTIANRKINISHS